MMGDQTMDIKDLIHELPKNIGKFKRKRYLHKLKVGIRHRLDEINLPADNLKMEAEYIKTAEEFKEYKSDTLCIRYKLPVINEDKLKLFISQSYYLKYLNDILFLEKIYQLNPDLFSAKNIKKYADLADAINTLDRNIWRISVKKNLTEVRGMYLNIDKDLAELATYYKKLTDIS